MDLAIIIPARLESVRLPRKPLAFIGDKQMICHVAARAKDSGAKNVIVATDSDEIAAAVQNEGVIQIITSMNHSNGTDRIYEALCKIDPYKKIKYVCNLQGDIPFMCSTVLKNLMDYRIKSKADIITLVSPLNKEETSKVNNPNVVKAAISFYDDARTHGKAIYFSRQPIPYNAAIYYEHIGVYLYTREALEEYVSSPITEIELSERLEQLRALSLGMSIDVLVTDKAPISVDTAQDLENAILEFRTLNSL